MLSPEHGIPAPIFCSIQMPMIPSCESECETSLSRVRLFATPWTVAHQALPSMEFSRQEYWSRLPQHILNAMSSIKVLLDEYDTLFQEWANYSLV